MSTTTRPVTQTADVAVNRAFKGDATSPDFVAKGNVSSRVPSAITPAKPYASIIVETPGLLGLGMMGRGTLKALTRGIRIILSPGLRRGICCIFIEFMNV